MSRSRAKLLPIAAAAAFAVAIVACGSKYNHPGAVGECNTDLDCHVGSPGGVTGGTPADGGGDSSGPVDAGPNSISIGNAEVHGGTSFVHAPKNDPLDTVDPLASLYFIGGVTHSGTVTGGIFSIPATDANQGEYGIIELFNDKDTSFPVRTIGHVLHDTATAQNFPGPLYFPMYPPDLNATMSATVGATKPLLNTATIVVQLVDSSGAPIAGVTGSMTGASTDCTAATAPPACGPYYDAPDGTGIRINAGGTGSNGTIVFLAVDGAGTLRTTPATVVVTVTKSGGAPVALPKLSMIQNAYSYVRHTLP